MTGYPTLADWAAAIADDTARHLSATLDLPLGVRVVYDHAPLTLTPTRSPVTNSAEVPLVFVDTETDGVHHGRYLSGQAGSPLQRFDGSRVSDPGRDMEYPEFAAVEIAKLTHGAYVVGAVPNFDTEVFDQLLRQAKLTPAWHYHLIDVETLAAGQLGIRPPWDFDALLGEYGLVYDEEQRHTAMGDVDMAAALYDAVMARADRRRAERSAREALELFPDAADA